MRYDEIRYDDDEMNDDLYLVSNTFRTLFVLPRAPCPVKDKSIYLALFGLIYCG